MKKVFLSLPLLVSTFAFAAPAVVPPAVGCFFRVVARDPHLEYDFSDTPVFVSLFTKDKEGRSVSELNFQVIGINDRFRVIFSADNRISISAQDSKGGLRAQLNYDDASRLLVHRIGLDLRLTADQKESLKILYKELRGEIVEGYVICEEIHK